MAPVLRVALSTKLTNLVFTIWCVKSLVFVAADRVIRVRARAWFDHTRFPLRFWGCLYCRFRPRTESSRLLRYSRRGTESHPRVSMRVGGRSRCRQSSGRRRHDSRHGPRISSAPALVDGKVFQTPLPAWRCWCRRDPYGQIRVTAKVEFTLCIGSAIEHQPFDVGVGDVAGKLPKLRSTRPGSLTDVRAFKLTRRMFWESHPEACCLRTCGHIPAVRIVGVRDPEGGRRVVGRNQLVGGILTLSAPSVGSDY